MSPGARVTPLAHMRGERIYDALNPKTHEVFMVVATEERYHGDGPGWRKYVLQAYRQRPHALGSVVLITDMIYARSAGRFARIHSDVVSQAKGTGVGALLYITAAAFIGDQGGAGIWSSGGSLEAQRLWSKLVASGMAIDYGADAATPYVITAPTAAASGLVSRRRRRRRR